MASHLDKCVPFADSKARQTVPVPIALMRLRCLRLEQRADDRDRMLPMQCAAPEPITHGSALVYTARSSRSATMRMAHF